MRIAFGAALVLLWITLSPAAPPGATPRPGGFWKCRAKSPIKGEFGGEDPVGLAGHSHIATDCVLNLPTGTGGYYCFASLPSREMFDSDTGDILAKAKAFWAAGPRTDDR